MRSGYWKGRRPTILGYEPGWLWWAAVLVLVVIGGWALKSELGQRKHNRAYLEERVAHHAAEQGLDPELVRAVVEAESGFDWQAESNLGAKGLMQVMPIALEDVQQRFDVGPGNLFDVDYNLHVGTLYLSYLVDRFDGDVRKAVQAYHMGPTSVRQGKTPGPQTRAYVKKVMRLLDEAQQPE